MGRTWDDERGPMVEPEPVEIDQRVQAVLARLDEVTARVLEVQGRHVSDRLVQERAHQEDVTEQYQAAAKELSRHILPPRKDYIPRDIAAIEAKYARPRVPQAWPAAE